jgi:hypothetical protein
MTASSLTRAEQAYDWDVRERRLAVPKGPRPYPGIHSQLENVSVKQPDRAVALMDDLMK